jgi:hypothetical protein
MNNASQSTTRPSDTRLTAAAFLLAHARDLASDESATTGYEAPVPNLYREAVMSLSVPQAKIMGDRRAPSLRVGAGPVEVIQAYMVLRSRVEELTARLDVTYESAERDEVELENLLETIEAAAQDATDMTQDEYGELDEDYSTDDDDTDMDCAAALRGARPVRGRSVRRLPIRGSAAQGKAEGLDPEVTEWLTPRELSRRRKAVALAGHPELSRHSSAGA